MSFKQGFADQMSFRRHSDGVSAFDLTNLAATALGVFVSFKVGRLFNKRRNSSEKEGTGKDTKVMSSERTNSGEPSDNGNVKSSTGSSAANELVAQ